MRLILQYSMALNCDYRHWADSIPTTLIDAEDITPSLLLIYLDSDHLPRQQDASGSGYWNLNSTAATARIARINTNTSSTQASLPF